MCDNLLRDKMRHKIQREKKICCILPICYHIVKSSQNVISTVFDLRKHKSRVNLKHLKMENLTSDSKAFKN